MPRHVGSVQVLTTSNQLLSLPGVGAVRLFDQHVLVRLAVETTLSTLQVRYSSKFCITSRPSCSLARSHYGLPMSDAQVRRRRPENKYDGSPSTKSESGPPSSSITIVKSPVTKGSEKGAMEWYRQQPAWIILALASGTCAAINGVFAKLYVLHLCLLRAICCTEPVWSQMQHGQ